MYKLEDIVFFDTEITANNKLADIGAIRNRAKFHSSNIAQFIEFSKNALFLCGHNIINHDYNFVRCAFEQKRQEMLLIDTLFWSPLLFPKRPYHKLVKDDKLSVDDLNNPCNDAQKAKELFRDEVDAFLRLPEYMKQIYSTLLIYMQGFHGFLKYIGPSLANDIEGIIRNNFRLKICENANISELIQQHPIELAYALAIIDSQDKHSITPAWVMNNFPYVEKIIRKLCYTKCVRGCSHCNNHLDVKKALKHYFGYDNYRTYAGEKLQENAVKAAVEGKSLLAIFPTGGGKSITFQVPALMAGENIQGLTVVISPLQSLMKDQVDNLGKKEITEAVTINGLLNPIERRSAMRRIADGSAWILYISPEALRSKTIEKLLLSRNVVRFVIDEAHCFSAWGQDFRIDYLHIAKFIKKYKERKNITEDIPVSCFTATAKKKVISDICDYFQKELGLTLDIFSTEATRKNLHYKVIYVENKEANSDYKEAKYNKLRELIKQKDCPTIVYVARVKTTGELAHRLTSDGFPALPYNGAMDTREKVENQNSFMKGDTDIIVATSAFGMGVDKDNVGLVIHYEISDSLENYVQEAGRAGRDQLLQADCYVLFNEGDLDKHFNLLNQTKLSISEIQQVWRAIKSITKKRFSFTRTPLEIAREAGWNDGSKDIETKVKTAIQTLEEAGYVIRGNNVPHVYATGILVENMQKGAELIDKSPLDESEKSTSKRILKYLIAKRYRSKAKNDDSESRVDYIADSLALETSEVVDIVNKMREQKILADSEDMVAYIKSDEDLPESRLDKLAEIEKFLIANYKELNSFSYKFMNDKAINEGIKKSTEKIIRNILLYWRISGIIVRMASDSKDNTSYELKISNEQLEKKFKKRVDIARELIRYLYNKAKSLEPDGKINFSILELQDIYNNRLSLFAKENQADMHEIKDTLLYLSKINLLDIEGGFLVYYNALQVERLVKDNKIKYKKENYEKLNEFYSQRIQQIHIVGEYARLMVKDTNEAQNFVKDYFNLDYKLFQRKYFKGSRLGEIEKGITPQKYNKLFGGLSKIQRTIIDDNTSKYIVVAAGPGSGKTRVLVHKLASLLLLEDIKSEQLLMLTFSRSAAVEFKHRLIELIGTPAHYIEIKTFHSYCFDLMGRIGSIEDSNEVIRKAIDMIVSGEVERARITKTVLVIDEAQDMSEEEFKLIQTLIYFNENMRVIAVGDDDQNIYEFRGSNSKFMKSLITQYKAKTYEMIENYRSTKEIISIANKYVSKLPYRMKKNEVEPVYSERGKVVIIKYRTKYLQTPIIDLIKNTYKGGSCCILTKTNDEAFTLTSLLKENGFNTRLIQSNEHFDLNNLYEFRWLIEQLKTRCPTPLIPQDIWLDTLLKFKQNFSDSTYFEECMYLINNFSSEYRQKYFSDLVTYLSESNLDNFVYKDKSLILVSTLHKAKGKEFDNVYIVLEDYDDTSCESKRALYVGMTRAKKALYIGYNNNLFDDYKGDNIEFLNDTKRYPPYQKLFIQLGLKDVNLGRFKFNQNKFDKVLSGSTLFIDGEYLSVQKGDKVIQLSKRSKETTQKIIKDGYTLKKADIRFKVFWKGKTEEKECLVILPNLYFSLEISKEKDKILPVPDGIEIFKPNTGCPEKIIPLKKSKNN